MTPTEVFKLFLRKGLEPNERLAFVRVIREKLYRKDDTFFRSVWYNEQVPPREEMERIFVERFMKLTWYTRNTLGRDGCSSCCTTLSSLMKYILYYNPQIIGTSKHKNKYLERGNIEIPNGKGYKRFWELRLIKKWHNFLNEYIANGDYRFWNINHIPNYVPKRIVEG